MSAPPPPLSELPLPVLLDLLTRACDLQEWHSDRGNKDLYLKEAQRWHVIYRAVQTAAAREKAAREAEAHARKADEAWERGEAALAVLEGMPDA